MTAHRFGKGQRYFDSYVYVPAGFYGDTAEDNETKALFWQALYNNVVVWADVFDGGNSESQVRK